MFHSLSPTRPRAALFAVALALPVLAGVAALAPASAEATCVSTAVTASLPDSMTDGGGIAPEITSLDVAVDTSCRATFSYAITGQTTYVGTDFLSWFVDLDGNTATGSQSGFRGADVALGRNGTGLPMLGTYYAATDSFVNPTPVTAVGTWGAQVDLAPLVPFGAHAMTVAGGSVYTGSSGTSYYDWAPNPGASPLGFVASLASYVAPTPTPAPAPVATPAPVAAPAPVVPTVPAVAGCTIPKLHGVALGAAKARLRKAGCKPGRVELQSSTTVRKGRVIRSKVLAGRQIAADRGVALVVSRGPATKRSAKAARATDAAPSITDALNALTAAAGAR